jgi:hypothetical protein
VASCQNGRSFTQGAFTLQKYFSPFPPFGPLDQLRWCLPLSEEDKDDNYEENGGALRLLDLGGDRGGREGFFEEGGSSGRSGGICEANQDSLSPAALEVSPSSSSLMVGG